MGAGPVQERVNTVDDWGIGYPSLASAGDTGYVATKVAELETTITAMVKADHI